MASEIKVNTIKDLGGNTIVSSNGSGTFTSNLPSTTLTGSTNNQVTTVTGANAITGETNFIYNGTIVGAGADGANADLGTGVHIKSGDSGQGSVEAEANLLILESASGGGLSIYTGNSHEAKINFGDSGNDNQGQIIYHHNGDSMRFNTNNNERMRITSGGNLLVGSSTASTGYARVSLVGGHADGTGANSGVQMTYNSGAYGGGAITTPEAAGGGLKFWNFTGNVGSESYTEVMKIDGAGIITKPLQPAFFTSGNGGGGTDIANNGNPYASNMTERFDKNADLSSTAVFTAPVTGTYLFTMAAYYIAVDETDKIHHFFSASNRNMYFQDKKMLNTTTGNDTALDTNGTCIVDMDANDTMTVKKGGGSTETRSSDPDYTWFGGYLLA